MLLAEDADPATGLKLWTILDGGGFSVGDVRGEPVVQTPTAEGPLGAIVLTCLDRIVAAGAATRAEIGPETLQARLEAERHATRATFVSDMRFGAWGRKPG